MRKRNRGIYALAIVIVCLASVLSSCSDNAQKYVPKHETEACSIDTCEDNNEFNKIEYNRKFAGANFTLYIDAALNDDRKIDEWIDRLSEFATLFQEKSFDAAYTVYLSDRVVAYYRVDTEEIVLAFPSALSAEETLAWILQAHGNGELPYGIYAGVAAYWLQKNEYSKFIVSSIGSADYLTELQFPLYESNNLPENQRTYAWGFSYTIVDDWVRSGRTEKELMTLSRAELDAHLLEAYTVVLPDYRFFPYSTEYEYKVEQDCFTYYINKQYNDLILPESRFDTSYDHLSAWLKDNAQTTEAANALFRVGTMYGIKVYLDDGLKSKGNTGEAKNDYIRLYSVGSFSHTYIYHALYQKGKTGYLSSVFSEYHANSSKFSNLMWYYLFSGEAKNFSYAESVKEKQFYKEAMQLYNRKSAFAASPDRFDYWLFADCFSALHTKKDEPFVFKVQSDSLFNYIARVYGGEYVWQLNLDLHSKIAGKTYSEVSYEWFDYLQTIK